MNQLGGEGSSSAIALSGKGINRHTSEGQKTIPFPERVMHAWSLHLEKPEEHIVFMETAKGPISRTNKKKKGLLQPLWCRCTQAIERAATPAAAFEHIPRRSIVAERATTTWTRSD